MRHKTKNTREGEAREPLSVIKKREFLKALEENKALISYAAKDSGVNKKTFYKWYNTDPEFKQAVDEITNDVLDWAERKLHENVADGDQRALEFFLMAKGKSRGYSRNDGQIQIGSVSPIQIILPQETKSISNTIIDITNDQEEDD